MLAQNYPNHRATAGCIGARQPLQPRKIMPALSLSLSRAGAGVPTINETKKHNNESQKEPKPAPERAPVETAADENNPLGLRVCGSGCIGE
jgi:hypothetical protein